MGFGGGNFHTLGADILNMTTNGVPDMVLEAKRASLDSAKYASDPRSARRFFDSLTNAVALASPELNDGRVFTPRVPRAHIPEYVFHDHGPEDYDLGRPTPERGPEWYAIEAKHVAMDSLKLPGPVPNLVSNLQATLATVRERNSQLEKEADELRRDQKSQCEVYQCLYAQVLALKRMLGVEENPGNHDYNGPADEDGRSVPDVVHERFHKAVGDVMAGDVMPKAREQMRKALDAAPKHEKTTASTGKPMPKGAIGFGQQVIGLRLP